MFALKPLDISEDKKTLRAEFYWLPSSNRPGPRDMATPPNILNAASTGDNVLLFNNTTKTVISSGHIIEFHTDDPVAKPLPSFELLRMQWILHRVAALAGAAMDEDDEDDDDDDDILGVGTYVGDDDDGDDGDDSYRWSSLGQSRLPPLKSAQQVRRRTWVSEGSGSSEEQERAMVIRGPGF